MCKLNVMIRYTVCLLCCLLLVQGCSDKDDPPQTTRVVSKRINIAKKQVSQQEQPVKKKIASKAETVAFGSVAQKSGQNAGQKVEQQIKQKDGQKSDMPPVVALNKDIKKENQSRSLALANIYNPKGKIDPFVPMFRETAVSTPVGTKKRKKRERRTRLEKIELGQLKLTGVIKISSENKDIYVAMIEEATGRGYIVKKGTPIGRNWGKITEILKDRIIIEEEVENLLGKVTLEKKEMKMQRPPGEL